MTSWTLVFASGQEGMTSSRDSLDRLCRSYWKPVFWHIHLRWRKSREDARDLTQAFFVWILERQLVASADPERGRFRTFLKVSLDNFLRNQQRFHHAKKRGGNVILLSLDDLDQEMPSSGAAVDFDSLFASSLLEQTAESLAERCQAEDRSDHFKAFRAYYLGEEVVTHATIAADLGQSETTVRRHLAWSLQAFIRLLRIRLRETLVDPDELEDEMHALFQGLLPR